MKSTGYLRLLKIYYFIFIITFCRCVLAWRHLFSVTDVRLARAATAWRLLYVHNNDAFVHNECFITLF